MALRKQVLPKLRSPAPIWNKSATQRSVGHQKQGCQMHLERPLPRHLETRLVEQGELEMQSETSKRASVVGTAGAVARSWTRLRRGRASRRVTRLLRSTSLVSCALLVVLWRSGPSNTCERLEDPARSKAFLLRGPGTTAHRN